MINEDGNFTFDLNVSTEPFPQKPQANAVKDITYTTQTITIDELEQRVVDGYAFCYNFLPTETGILTQQDRRIERFDYTNLVFYDFDKMPTPMEEFIETLAFKPSLAYTTYSNGTNGKFSYRLVYAFRLRICNEKEFEKTYWGLATANGFQSGTYPDGTTYGFDFRKVNQQYYGGGEHTITYKSDNTYFANDFFPYYQSNNTNNNIPCKNKELKDKKDVGTSCSYLETEFKADLKKLLPSDFIDKYRWKYETNYIKSLSSEMTLSEDNSYYILPSDYKEVKHHPCRDANGKVYMKRWKDKQGRRRKLYITAKIMLCNQPDMTLEQLVYNLMRERQDFYDYSDGTLNADTLVKIAKNAFDYRDIPFTKPFKHSKYKVNKEYWQERGYNAQQASRFIYKERHLQEVASVYDFSKSVNENLEVMRSMGIKVGKSYLYEFRKKYSDTTVSTEEIPFKDKDMEDVSTSCSYMENGEEKKNTHISCSQLEWVRNIMRHYHLRRKDCVKSSTQPQNDNLILREYC